MNSSAAFPAPTPQWPMAPGSFNLCYITDRQQLRSESLSLRIQKAIQAGVDLIQIREKDLSARELLQLAKHAVAAARGRGEAQDPLSGPALFQGSRIVVNDRLDVAMAAEAHGVHLGTQSMPARVVRSMVPEKFLVGVSCHSLEEARAAESSGADYILLGPVFETPSKLAYGPPLGLEKLRGVATLVKIPVIALGGIAVSRVWPCLEAGAAGIAGIRVFQECESLEVRVAELRALIASFRFVA
jgi:thiamine-phosphate pyrophosphorylase